MGDDDSSVVRDVLRGDRERFRVLVERYEAPVFAVIRSFLRADPRCEDIAQDVLLTAFARLTTYRDDRGGFRPWLLTIARNKCRDVLRRRTASALTNEARDALQAPAAPDTPLEVDELLNGALDRLPPERRVAFVLTEMYGLSYEEVANIEGVAVGTAKSRAGRARETLRGLLSQRVEERR